MNNKYLIEVRKHAKYKQCDFNQNKSAAAFCYEVAAWVWYVLQLLFREKSSKSLVTQDPLRLKEKTKHTSGILRVCQKFIKRSNVA
jgi:hypothetical protein